MNRPPRLGDGELQGTDPSCALLDGWTQINASGQRVALATVRSDDDALANLGHLKAVFSFDP